MRSWRLSRGRRPTQSERRCQRPLHFRTGPDGEPADAAAPRHLSFATFGRTAAPDPATSSALKRVPSWAAQRQHGPPRGRPLRSITPDVCHLSRCRAGMTSSARGGRTCDGRSAGSWRSARRAWSPWVRRLASIRPRSTDSRRWSSTTTSASSRSLRFGSGPSPRESVASPFGLASRHDSAAASGAAAPAAAVAETRPSSSGPRRATRCRQLARRAASQTAGREYRRHLDSACARARSTRSMCWMRSS